MIDPAPSSCGMRTHSTLTCPACGHAEDLDMPTDACQFFHECRSCHTVLRPRPGDCCVFCSYGSVPCPPVQQARAGCCDSSAAKPAGQA